MSRIAISAFAVACMACLVGGTVQAWNHRGPVAPEVSIVVEPVAPVSPPAPGSVHCVHEVCAARPSRLDCADYSTYLCHNYSVVYEHHCDCDRWEP